MTKIRTLCTQSMKELKSTHCLVLTALLIALNVTLDLLNIRIWITPELRFGISFVLNASIAMLYGPSVGIMAGFCTDVLGYLVNASGGAYFPGYTLTAMLGGFLYGIWLYPHRPTKLRVIGAKISINLLCNIGLNTLWQTMTGGKALAVLLPARVAKNVLLLPFEVLLLFIVTNMVEQIYRRMAQPRPQTK